MNLNLEIAKVKGAEIINVIDNIPYCKNVLFDKPQPFDYQNDWNYLGPLEDELLNAEWYLEKVGDHYQWQHYEKRLLISSEHRGTATCMAYLKEFSDET